MTDEWGPWIDGSIAPLKLVDLKGRGSFLHEAIVLGFDGEDLILSPLVPFARQWELDKYRIRKPRALLQLIEMAENLPVKEGELV